MRVKREYLGKSIFEFVNLEKELEKDNQILVIISFDDEAENKDLLIEKLDNLDIELICIRDFEMYLLIYSSDVLFKIYEYILDFRFVGILSLKTDIKKEDILKWVRKNSFTKLLYGIYHLKTWDKIANVLIFLDVYHLAGFKQSLKDF